MKAVQGPFLVPMGPVGTLFLHVLTFPLTLLQGTAPRDHFPSSLNLADRRGWKRVLREMGAGAFRSDSGVLGAE